jgi:Na+-driven multidrug efflux pump
VGCFINLICDPIAIFVLHWGMMGAAVATVAGQIVTCLMCVLYLTHSKTFKLEKASFVPSHAVLGRVLPLGVSSFLTQISIVLITAVMNNTLVAYGAHSRFGADIPLTVVGIVMKVFQIVIAFVVGIAAGSQPIVGYNYGAGNLARVKELFRKMMTAEIVVGLVATVAFEAFPLQIISIFGSGDALYNEFAALTFRIFLGTILLCCIQKSCSIFLQALGKPVLSTALSLLRDFVLSVPMVVILAGRFGVVGPLFSAPVADVVSFVVTVIIIKHTMAHLAQGEKEEETLAQAA